MRISDWSSDVCSSDLAVVLAVDPERERISLGVKQLEQDPMGQYVASNAKGSIVKGIVKEVDAKGAVVELEGGVEGYVAARDIAKERVDDARSEEHTSELQSLMRISYAVFCLKKKNKPVQTIMQCQDKANIRP